MIRFYKFYIALVLCFTVLNGYSVKAEATPTFTLYFNGLVVTDGIIQYQGDSVVIGISGSETGFTVYYDGGVLVIAAAGTNYVEATLTMPMGEKSIYIESENGSSTYQKYNFYHVTNANPNATFTYASYEFVVNMINDTYTGTTDVLSYVGEVLYQGEVNDLFTKYKDIVEPKLTVGQQYDLSGWVRVRVFDSAGNKVGEYNCNNGSKVNNFGIYDNLYNPNEYKWSDGTTDPSNNTLNDFYSRRTWSATQPFTEDKKPAVLEFKIMYDNEDKTDGTIEIDSVPYYVDLLDLSKNVTTWKWYIKTTSSTDWELFSTEQNPINVSVWHDGKTEFKLVIDGGLEKEHSITAAIKPPPPGTGNLVMIGKDVNTGAILASKNETLSYDTTNGTLYTRKYTDLGTIPNVVFDGSISTYSAGVPATASRTKAESQTVKLDNTNKTAYIYFYFIVDSPIITPTPTPTHTNLPPVAIINSADSVMMGDDIAIESGSYDPDGYLVSQVWTAPTVKIPLIDYGGKTWFDCVGIATIKLKVVDNKGSSDSTSKTISILPPIPTAVITYTGRLKENYKITVDSVKSISPFRYPIDSTKTVWKITAVSGCSDSDIKYLSTLTGVQNKDFLVKKSGRIKVDLTVTNTAGYSNTTSTLLDIQPNLPPVAQFYVPSRTLRENVDAQGKRYGETIVYDTSYSPDGDKIILRKYYCRWDSDNDDNFEEETLNMFYEGGATEALLRYYNNQAVGWCRYDIYVEEDLMEKDSNGNYINTIPEFIGPEDIKYDDTFDITN